MVSRTFAPSEIRPLLDLSVDLHGSLQIRSIRSSGRQIHHAAKDLSAIIHLRNRMQELIIGDGGGDQGDRAFPRGACSCRLLATSWGKGM